MQTYASYVSSLIKEHRLDAYLTFTSDCHLNEYQCEVDMRVKMLTGFTETNGIAVTCSNNVLITDSRHYIQASIESSYPLHKGLLSDYLASSGFHRVGLDPRLISAKSLKDLKKKLDSTNVSFVEIESGPVERPSGPLMNLENVKLADYLSHPPIRGNSGGNRLEEYLERLGFTNIKGNVTGSTYSDKIVRVRNEIKGVPLVITELDSIAWILNHRGSDIEYNPLFFAYLIIEESCVKLFTNHSIELCGVDVYKYAEFESYIKNASYEKVLISGNCNRFVHSCFKSAEFTDVVRKMQASKNDCELAGMVLAYFYDSIALTNLFGFMKENDGYTENDIAEKLEVYKRDFPGYIGPSFPTISATRANCAIVHHASTDDLVGKVFPFLLDCGSHYVFGTTDTSRTLLLETGDRKYYFDAGEGILADRSIDKNTNETDSVNQEYKPVIKEFIHDYTLVFKGQVNAMLREYTGSDTYSTIDCIARQYLKGENKDFGHATGHGVGHVLCVHEHPPTISKNSNSPIEPRHVFSIEPGYYRENIYGIRLENLVISESREESCVLRNITMVPYQVSILDCSMLTAEEKTYLNTFNEACRWLLDRYVNESGRQYLHDNCAGL